MPPTKKAKTSTPEEPDEPLNFITHIREKSERRFAIPGKVENVQNEIEQNIREIRALLKINSEIFARCIDSATTNNGKAASFTRYGFDAVKVRQTQAASQFITEYERATQRFNMKPLSQLPDGLKDVFVVKKHTEPSNDMFIDYNAFFETALMLHDSILEPFLAKLKSHIELIHVGLGQIETFLIEPERNIQFIESVFGKKLERPTADDFDKDCTCPVGTHVGSDMCLNCNRKYSCHSLRRYSVKYQIDQVRNSVYRCWCPSGRQQIFRCKKFHILKTCKSGIPEATFSISNQSDQAELMKLLSTCA